MKRLVASLLVALALSGCTPTPPPSYALLPPGAFGGNGDNDMMAINTAEWAFSNPARTRGNLVNATRAVLAIEYLAGQLSWSPRWDYMSPLTKQDMLAARVEVRSVLGIDQAAPSQLVANALLALSAYPTKATADKVIRPPVFTLPTDETVARIENLPYMPVVNNAAARAGAQQYLPNDHCFVCG